ncbi:MAG TPA: hypothetical protein VI980_06755, partial [Acidimicrobiia bacterium]|nr:hypothetical protein [Acidimicrobiia bacterium]
SSTESQVTVVTLDRSRGRYRSRVGFNPFREQDKSAADIAAVVVALIAIIAVVAWAIFSG